MNELGGWAELGISIDEILSVPTPTLYWDFEVSVCLVVCLVFELGLKFAIFTTFHTLSLPACEVILFLADARQPQILPEFSTLNESGIGA